MMKHTYDDLVIMQSLPLEIKVRMTEERIRSFVKEFGVNGCYISYSGGKDSTVLRHIAKGLYPEIPAVFSDTGLEYPEVRRLAIANADEVIKPEMIFREVIEKYGYPIVGKEVAQSVYYARRNGCGHDYDKLFGLLKDENGKKSKYCTEKWSYLYNAPFRVSHRCCDEMKKKPFGKYSRSTGRYPITAEMADEGMRRKTAWLRTGCNVYMGKPKSKPMSFWTEHDVLMYIHENDIEIPSVYGEIIETPAGLKTTGCNRTGCVFCGFGAHLEGEPNRFQRLAETHPKLWKYCINGGEYDDHGMWNPNKKGLGMGKVLDFIGVKYENDPSLFDFEEGEKG